MVSRRLALNNVAANAFILHIGVLYYSAIVEVNDSLTRRW